MTVALISIRSIPAPCPVALFGFTLISDTIIINGTEVRRPLSPHYKDLQISGGEAPNFHNVAFDGGDWLDQCSIYLIPGKAAPGISWTEGPRNILDAYRIINDYIGLCAEEDEDYYDEITA